MDQSNFWKVLITFITVTPALAWFVTSSIKLYKLYRKKEFQIKTKAALAAKGMKEGTVKTAGKLQKTAAKTAEKLQDKLEEEAKKLKDQQ